MNNRRRMTAFDFFNLTVLWFGMAFQWGAILGIFLQKQTILLSPDSHKGLYYSILAGSGALVAGIVQLLIGGISDRTRSRWGRRKPYIFAGVLLSSIPLLGMGMAGSFPMLVVYLIGLQIFANIASGPYHALAPDLVTDEQQGIASAWINVFSFLGQALGPLFAGFLLSESGGSLKLMIWISALINVLMFYTMFFLKENVEEGEGGREAVESVDRPDKPWYSYKNFFWITFSRTIFNMGFYTAIGFLIYFLKDTLQIQQFEKYTGIFLMIATLAGILSAFPAGIMSDRFSKKKMLCFSGILIAFSAIGIVFAGSISQVIICGLSLGLGLGVFSTVDWALLCVNIPSGKGGRFMAIWNLSFIIPQIIAPIVAGHPSDLINRYAGAGTGYRAIFALVALYILAGVLSLRPVEEREKKKD